MQNEPPKSMPWAAVNAESENTRNSAGNRIRMTDSGQSRKEAAVTTTGAVSAKTTTLIGFWNVRTMYEQGRMAQVIAEMKRYKLDILGISESRWTKSGRMILRIFWPNVISNKDLFERCGTEPMATILMRRRWRWIGHVTRQEASIAKTAMHWTPEGKRKRVRPKITWRRTIEKEIKEMGKTWEGIKFMARDRQMWREHVAALHAT